MQLKNPFATRSPYEEIEAARRGRLVEAVGRAAIVFAIPMSILLVLIFRPQSSIMLVITLGFVLGIIPAAYISMKLARSGRVDAGGFFFEVYMLLILAINTVIIDGLLPILIAAYLVLIVIAGMIFKPWQSYAVGIIAGAMFLLVRWYIFLEGAFVTIPEFSTTITVLVTVLFSFGFIAYLNQVNTRDLRDALDEATFNLIEANQLLEEASKRKSQFTARTSHELRTPLSAIIVFADLALREAYGPLNDKLITAQQHIVNSARHLKRIINDLLDLSKIEAGQLEVTHEQFELEGITDVIESTCQPIATEKGIDWSIVIDKSMPPILIGDAERISQIAVNICGNAVKFTEKGQVEVRIEKMDEENWVIVVRDSGPGIPVDEQEIIFEAFRSMDKSGSKSVARGTGLGLAIARNLAQMMGGEITLRSKLGVGSTFQVRLPFKPHEGFNEHVGAPE